MFDYNKVRVELERVVAEIVADPYRIDRYLAVYPDGSWLTTDHPMDGAVRLPNWAECSDQEIEESASDLVWEILTDLLCDD